MENVDLKIKFIFLLFISFSIGGAELKISDDFKEGDILSAETFNQIFDTIEKINREVKDTDLVGTWTCNAMTTRNTSGWDNKGVFYQLSDAQVNFTASSATTSFESAYTVSTSSPSPFKRTSGAFSGTYVLFKNKMFTKTSDESDARIWDVNLISPTRVEFTFLETSAQSFPANYASFISCDSANAVPAAPVNPTAENNRTSINLAWTDASSDESGFKIFRKRSSDNSFTLISTQTSTTYADNDLIEGESPSYYIKAYNSHGDSAQSKVISATLDDTAPIVSSTTPATNGSISRQGSITVTFSESIKIVCPAGDSYSDMECPSSGAPLTLSILVDGSTRSGTLGYVGSISQTLSGSPSRGSAERYDANQSNINVTIHKEWIKDINGLPMSQDFQFIINVNNVIDNPNCPPSC